jgi:hypothetical protein
MKAIEFTGKIKNNSITIPAHLKNELKQERDMEVRVIVLIDDASKADYNVVLEAESAYFLKGYDDVDAAYDTYEP